LKEAQADVALKHTMSDEDRAETQSINPKNLTLLLFLWQQITTCIHLPGET